MSAVRTATEYRINGITPEGATTAPSKGRQPAAGQLVRQSPADQLARMRPRPSTILVSMLALKYARPGASATALRRLFHWIALSILVLNWRIVPFYWHVMTLFFPVIKSKFIRWKLGASTKSFVYNSGILGKSPFEARIISKHCATWNTCDFMLHMSNSAYAIALDEARAIWQTHVLGTSMRADHERTRPMIASTHFTYFAEIPILADFLVDIRPVAWDHKWLYLLATFTTEPCKGSQTRTLNCLSITRMVNKIGRRTVRPERLMALNGMGQEASEWDTLSRVRAQEDPKLHNKRSVLSPAQEWLLSSEPFEPFLKYEPIRKKNLEIIRAALDGDLANGAERLKDL